MLSNEEQGSIPITSPKVWVYLTGIEIEPMGGCSSAVAPEDSNGQHNGKSNWCVCCSRQDSAAALLSKTERDLDCERPTPEEAKKWQTSFESMLKNKFGVQLFQDFLRSQYGEENLNFWLAVEEYKTVEEEGRAERARVIYEDYVSTLSPTEISLDAKVRAEIDNNMNNPTEDTFKVAQDHIFTLMYHDCFPRFIKSKHYKQLLKRHWSNKDPNPRIAFVTKSFDLTIQPSLDVKLFRRNLELYAQQRHPIYRFFFQMYWTRVSAEIKSFRSKNEVVYDWSVMGLLKTGFGNERPTFNSSVNRLSVTSMTRRNAGTYGSESTADQSGHQSECSSNTRKNSAFTFQWLTD